MRDSGIESGSGRGYGVWISNGLDIICKMSIFCIRYFFLHVSDNAIKKRNRSLAIENVFAFLKFFSPHSGTSVPWCCSEQQKACLSFRCHDLHVFPGDAKLERLQTKVCHHVSGTGMTSHSGST